MTSNVEVPIIICGQYSSIITNAIPAANVVLLAIYLITRATVMNIWTGSGINFNFAQIVRPRGCYIDKNTGALCIDIL